MVDHTVPEQLPPQSDLLLRLLRELGELKRPCTERRERVPAMVHLLAGLHDLTKWWMPEARYNIMCRRRFGPQAGLDQLRKEAEGLQGIVSDLIQGYLELSGIGQPSSERASKCYDTPSPDSPTLGRIPPLRGAL